MTKRILVIEDEPQMLLGLRDNLELEGYEVVTASDGEDGLAKAISTAPDLVVLDVTLPRKNGFEVCRELRARANPTPVVMLTARSQETEKVLGLELGADDYITKPFSITEVPSSVLRGGAFIRNMARDDRRAVILTAARHRRGHDARRSNIRILVLGQQFANATVVHHAVNAVGGQQQQLAARQCLLDHVHVGPRARSNDVGQRVDHRMVHEQQAIGGWIICEHLRNPRIVACDLAQAVPIQQIQTAVAGVRHGEAAGRNARGDDRRTHAGVGIGRDGRLEDLKVCELNRRSQNVCVRRQRMVVAEREARLCGGSFRPAIGSRP